MRARFFETQCILTTDRPVVWKNSNGHIAARVRHPIHFMFGSGVGFSGSSDRMALFPVGRNSKRGM